MPTYEYRCEKGHTFEVMQRMSDAPVASCETCDAPVARVFHPVAVHFKGKGFYNTDYGTQKRSRELKEAAEGSGDKKAKDEGGSKSDKGDSGSKTSDASKPSSDSKSKSSDSGTAAAA